MYRVLWIDDQPDKLPYVIQEAKELYDIELINCRFKSVGIKELEKPKPQYDAVVLDAFLVNESIDEEPAKRHLIDILNRLQQLKGMNIHIPYLVFSANAGTLMSDQTFLELTSGTPVFQKTLEGAPKMFLKLIEMIKNRPEEEMKFYYGSALELCTSKYIGERYNDYLKPLLRLLEDKTQIIDTQEFRDNLRFILEGITEKFRNMGVIPQGTTERERGLNWECNILIGRAFGYTSNTEILPPAISHILKNILDLAQDTMHDRPGLTLQVNAYLKKQGTRHMICGAVLYLVEVMQFCKNIFDEYSIYQHEIPIVQKNIGHVAKDKSLRQFICENFSGKYLISDKIQVKEDDKILITRWKENTNNSTMNQYKRYATEVNILRV